MENRVEMEWAILEYKDNILTMRIKEGTNIDMELYAKINVKQVEMIGDDNFAYVVDGREQYTMTKESRKMVSTNPDSNCVATAIVTGNNLLTRMLVNFIMKVDKSSVPSKMFELEKEALEWLKPFLSKN